MNYTFVLVKNPNCEKNTMFNEITGSLLWQCLQDWWLKRLLYRQWEYIMVCISDRYGVAGCIFDISDLEVYLDLNKI
jgi:beta-glucosidase-like glycosyl hydrolase